MDHSFIPRFMFLTKGVGIHKEKLASLELALRDAGIAGFNLVKVSSIFPPGCKLLSKEKGLKFLKKGQIVFIVMSENSSNEPHRLISASIGLAIPKRKDIHGYLAEHHAFGQTAKIAGEYAEDLAAFMLASTLGLPFDPEKNYDERKEVWKISGYEVITRNITQTAKCDKSGKWTTVVAGAVFIP
jgi:arginine decarboxylase